MSLSGVGRVVASMLAETNHGAYQQFLLGPFSDWTGRGKTELVPGWDDCGRSAGFVADADGDETMGGSGYACQVDACLFAYR